jgi:hypothetical protein
VLVCLSFLDLLKWMFLIVKMSRLQEFGTGWMRRRLGVVQMSCGSDRTHIRQEQTKLKAWILSFGILTAYKIIINRCELPVKYKCSITGRIFKGVFCINYTNGKAI